MASFGCADLCHPAMRLIAAVMPRVPVRGRSGIAATVGMSNSRGYGEGHRVQAADTPRGMGSQKIPCQGTIGAQGRHELAGSSSTALVGPSNCSQTSLCKTELVLGPFTRGCGTQLRPHSPIKCGHSLFATPSCTMRTRKVPQASIASTLSPSKNKAWSECSTMSRPPTSCEKSTGGYYPFSLSSTFSLFWTDRTWGMPKSPGWRRICR